MHDVGLEEVTMQKYMTHLLALLLFAASAGSAIAQAKSCETLPAYHVMDFWLGSWDVYEKDELVGTNVIEKVIGGCAILENWVESTGGEGKSFFYYNRLTERWKQVWVQDDGFWKEKEMQPGAVEDGVRFQGTIQLKNGNRFLDRTTLTLQKYGHVRQLIETSRDGGKTWTPSFDAIYIKRKPPMLPAN